MLLLSIASKGSEQHYQLPRSQRKKRGQQNLDTLQDHAQALILQRWLTSNKVQTSSTQKHDNKKSLRSAPGISKLFEEIFDSLGSLGRS